MATYDVNKLTKLGALKQLAQRIKDGYVTQEDFNEVSDSVALLQTNYGDLQGKVTVLEETGGEANIIESITVNNEETDVLDKTVNITVPKKTSELDNDAGFKDESGVQSMIDAGINKFKTDVTSDDTINTFKELVDYVAAHGEEAAELMQNISNLETLVGEESVSTQIATALTNYIQKDGNKVLSTNDYTTEDKEKVDTIDYATDEEISEMLEEVFSVTE